MQTLHISLQSLDPEHVELRYFFDNPNQYQPRSLPAQELADLVTVAERDYYTPLPEDLVTTGRRLYNWLDGSDRWLERMLADRRGEGLVLAITTTGRLAHLPWEVLHDGISFLVQRRNPTIVPVRWFPLPANQTAATSPAAPANRALQVLFMATSPAGVEPVLDFEAEEGRILTATARQPLALVVEESGCLEELRYVVDAYGRDYFDVVHLTGHATLGAEGARFLTETATGGVQPASAAEIADALRFQMPGLLFLSGCRTGQAGAAGAVPSLAEALLSQGARAVLGWGRPVLDQAATEAAAALYEALAAAHEISEAVALTYQKLMDRQVPDWHLLRLYITGAVPGAFVTPLRTSGRKAAPPSSVTTQFLDTAGYVKVPTREGFVGRRRVLQHCLRALTQMPDRVGVLIHGLGGVGKSSLAARLCDRLPHYERLVWVGGLDEARLVSRLAERLEDPTLRQRLQATDDALRFRLRQVLRQQGETGKPWLLVLDDFEGNLEPRDGSYVLTPQAAAVLDALVWAIRETSTPHRLLLTCRYNIGFTPLQHVHTQPLAALRGADLRKKCERLTAFNAQSQVERALREQAATMADGNPRLLEWLDKILRAEGTDTARILTRMAETAVAFREHILAEELLAQQPADVLRMLSCALIYESPVPFAALEAVSDGIPELRRHMQRAVALGLLEVSTSETDTAPHYRVPRILQPPLACPDNPEALSRAAAQSLYRLWRVEATSSAEEQRREIHRLALRGKVEGIAAEMADVLASRWVNQSRFRDAVQICKETLSIAPDYRVFHALARAEQPLGEVDAALEHYQHALRLCASEDENEQVAIIHNTATIYAQQGQVAEAVRLYQQSLDIKERIGNAQGKAATLHQMAGIYARQGQVEDAVRLYQQSLDIKERIGDAQGKAATLHAMAGIYARQGQVAKAMGLYQQVLDIDERIGDAQGKAATLHQMAGIYARQEQVEEAVRLYQQSLDIDERIGDVQGKAVTLAMMGQLLATRGDGVTAMDYLRVSLGLLEQLKSPDAQTVRDIIARLEQRPQGA